MRKSFAAILLCATAHAARADWDSYATTAIGIQAPRGGAFADHFDALMAERFTLGLRVQNVALEGVGTLLDADGRGDFGGRIFFTLMGGVGLRGDLPVSVDTTVYLRAGYAFADFNDCHAPSDQGSDGSAHHYSAGIETVIYRDTQHTPTGPHRWYISLFAEVEHASIDIGRYQGAPVGGAATYVLIGMKTGSGDR